MISQLFALPLRALIVVAALPTPPAQGGILADPGGAPGPAMMASLPDRGGFTLEVRIAPTRSPVPPKILPADEPADGSRYRSNP